MLPKYNRSKHFIGSRFTVMTTGSGRQNLITNNEVLDFYLGNKEDLAKC